MPSIELKRPVALNGQDYKRGVHDVSEEVVGHWMIQAMIADGDAVALAEAKAPEAPKKQEPAKEPAKEPDGDAVALAEAKAELDRLGVSYGVNIGLKTALERIAAAKADQAEKE